jgi:hypothetical protein
MKETTKTVRKMELVSCNLQMGLCIEELSKTMRLTEKGCTIGLTARSTKGSEKATKCMEGEN